MEIILIIIALAAGAAAWYSVRDKSAVAAAIWDKAPYKVEAPVVESVVEVAPAKAPRKPRAVKAAPAAKVTKKPAKTAKVVARAPAARISAGKATTAKKVKTPSKKV